VAAAGSAAILAGCGDDDDDDSSAAPAATAAATSAATAAATAAATEAAEAAATPVPTEAPAPGVDKRGGTLKLWKKEEDAGLDPAVFHVNNTEVIYSTMTQPYTYQPTKNIISRDGMVGWEQVDPTTWVWSLREGMKFHNGDPVNSEAVAFSFSRLPELYQALGATHVTNTGFTFVDTFEATDENTVVENWKSPNADAPIYRARHYYSFVNPRMVDEHGALEGTIELADGSTKDIYSVQSMPLGSASGPYTLTRRDAIGTKVERWADYHGHPEEDDGFVADGPYIDSWETRIIPDFAAAKSAFLAGELDVYADVDPLELGDFEGQDHLAILELPAGGYSHIGMDGGKFHDKRSRQALQKGFDYEGFIAALRPFGGKYQGPISNLLTAYALSQEELQEYYRYDPKEARALWAAADFLHPLESIKVFMSGGNALQEQIGQFMAQSLAEGLGIETEVEAVDTNTWAARALERAQVKDWELLAYGIGTSGGTTGLPNDSSLIHYDPRGYGNSAFNHSLAEDLDPRPEIIEDGNAMIALLEAQEQETDPEARTEKLKDLQHWILDRHWCNWSLPQSSVSYYGFSSRLKDFAPNDYLNFYSNRRESMWLDDA
tara:strand:- start:7952 stop:9769 length:1818 start_codon:yes stop_codon:yes gene_type:complete